MSTISTLSSAIKLTGTFSSGCPFTEIEIRHPGTGAVPVKFPAVLDTGFDGFLWMPMSVAKDLGMKKGPTAPVRVADNALVPALLSECIVTIAGEDVQGHALVWHKASNILVGLALLGAARLSLHIDPANGFWELLRTPPS